MNRKNVQRKVRGALLGLLIVSGTLFQANGCTVTVDGLDGLNGLLDTIVNSDPSWSEPTTSPSISLPSYGSYPDTWW